MAMGRSYLRDGIVVAEVALALILLVGAGLLIRSFLGLMNVDPGFSPQNALTMNISLPEARYASARPMIAFEQQTLEPTRRLARNKVRRWRVWASPWQRSCSRRFYCRRATRPVRGSSAIYRSQESDRRRFLQSHWDPAAKRPLL